MKKIIYSAVIIFSVFQFLATADSAFGQLSSCSDNGGVCMSGPACVNGYNIISGIGCRSTQVCCRATGTNTSCVDNGGRCMEGASCGSGYESISGIGCRTAQVCCRSTGTVPAASSGNAIVFESPLRFTTVEGLLGAVLAAFRGVVVVLALIFFVWGAILYITSAGSDDRIKSGKNAMSASLIGLALGIAAPSLLKTIAMVLDWDNTSAELASAPSATEIGLRILEFLLGIVGVLGMIMIIVGGVMYFAAGANEKSVDTAKGIVKYAVIGIFLALASMVIVKQVAALLT